MLMPIPSTSSKILHFQAGESFIIHSGTSTQPYDIYLSITALQDQVPQAISARPGMVLETLTGVCDGRTITVSSGTYTLQNVTAKQDGTGTFIALTGSTIDYKPPPCLDLRSRGGHRTHHRSSSLRTAPALCFRCAAAASAREPQTTRPAYRRRRGGGRTRFDHEGSRERRRPRDCAFAPKRNSW